MTWYRATMTLLAVGVLGSACGEAFTGTGPDGTTTGSGGTTTSATAAAGGETSATMSTGSQATNGNGGSGGRACLTCDEAIAAPMKKLSPDLVCSGPEKDDYTDFIECLCLGPIPRPCGEACLTYCEDIEQLTDACEDCIIDGSVCQTHYEDCQEVSQ